MWRNKKWRIVVHLCIGALLFACGYLVATFRHRLAGASLSATVTQKLSQGFIYGLIIEKLREGHVDQALEFASALQSNEYAFARTFIEYCDMDTRRYGRKVLGAVDNRGAGDNPMDEKARDEKVTVVHPSH